MKRSEAMDRLFQSFLNLESIDECYAYFEDLCTIKELNDMAQRLEVAILLSQGLSYQKITEQVTSAPPPLAESANASITAPAATKPP